MSHSPEDGIDLARVRSLDSEVIANVKPSLLLQKLHPLFYRVADKEMRAHVQHSTYQYLLGYVAKPIVTSVATLDQLLRSPEALLLREQVLFTRKNSLPAALEKYSDMDEYEIRYLLSRDALMVKANSTKTQSKRN